MRNVKDFGAVGDGKTKDTAAIQRAIDAGEIVHFPAGTYLTGTLYLQSNGGLDLDAGAVILGSPDRADYNLPDAWPQNWASVQEKAGGGHLIVALEKTNISIRGGRIDGNRKAFFDPTQYSRDEFTGWRPSQMINICECREVRIENVKMTNSPYWTCFLYGCTDVWLRGLLIEEEERKTWNGDGIDIDACSRVTVSDCIIRSSDDSLAIRAAGGKRLQHKENVCEDVTVTNCVLSSGQAAIRLGVGTGTVRNCVFSNITAHSCYGIVLLSTYLPELFPGGARGVEIYNVLFSNMFIQARVPFDLSSNWTNPPLKSSEHTIHDIRFRDMIAEGCMTNIFQGNDDFNMTDIELSDIQLTMAGDLDRGEAGQESACGSIMPDLKADRHSWSVYQRPCAMYIRNCERMTFRRFTCRWRDEQPDWQCTAYLKNNRSLTFDDCTLNRPVNGIEKEVSLE